VNDQSLDSTILEFLTKGRASYKLIAQGVVVSLPGVQAPLNQVPIVREENQDDEKIRQVCCGIVTRGHVCVCDSSARDAFGQLVDTQGVADHSGIRQTR
jgi:hypothetical protein